MTQWPDHYPAMCPPADAAPASGRFIRFVDAVPPSGDDTMSYVELRISGRRKFKTEDFGKLECEASGFSMYDTIENAEAARKGMRPLQKKMLASVDITGDGKVKRTAEKKGHHTWWRPLGDSDWTQIEVVT